MEVNGSSCRRINENPSELRQRIRAMEEDQEELNNSLMALTSHFAKVTRTKLLFLIPKLNSTTDGTAKIFLPGYAADGIQTHVSRVAP